MKLRTHQILDRLCALLEELWDERPAGRLIDTDAPLTGLGVDSLTLVLLLDRIAHEFGVDWEQAAAVGVGGSLRSLAELIAQASTDPSIQSPQLPQSATATATATATAAAETQA
jgi:clorobiocin biosynthesis protein CloN1